MARLQRWNACGLVFAISLMTLSGCGSGFNFDFRNPSSGYNSAGGTARGVEARPAPDSRGIISYPNFQVVVAAHGDTASSIAERVGIDEETLADYNGISPDARLRQGEILALPGRASKPPPVSDEIDITVLAGEALDRADAGQGGPPFEIKPVSRRTGREPIQHRAAPGETAYSIARLYGVPVRSLSDWNGLGPRNELREGQYLLIPITRRANPPGNRGNEGGKAWRREPDAATTERIDSAAEEKSREPRCSAALAELGEPTHRSFRRAAVASARQWHDHPQLQGRRN